MALDPEFLAILRCPSDRGELTYNEAGATLTCNACGLVYGVLEGDIPNLLIEEATKPPR